MKICNKTYIKIDEVNGQNFFGYKAYFDDPYHYCDWDDPDGIIVFSYPILEELDEHFDNFLNNSFVPNPGDEIHVVPGCIIPMQDIRNNYKVKRTIDSGVCNVFSPMHGKAYKNIWGFNTIIACRELNALYFTCTTSKGLTETNARIVFGAVEPGAHDYSNSIDIIDISHLEIYYSRSINENYMKLYAGQFKKPCIHSNSLKLQKNQMTSDILSFFVKAGLRSTYSKDADKNFLVQLGILNQYNWKDYTGTMYYIKQILISKGGIHNYYMRHSSRLPKYGKDWYSTEFSPIFCSEEDFKLCQDFVSSCIGLNGKTFVNNRALCSKLSEIHLGLNDFDELYGTVTKVIPRNYEDWKSKHSIC